MDQASKELKKRIIKTIFWLITGAVALSILVLFTLLSLGISIFAISGPSMQPTLHNRDSIILKQEKLLDDGQIFIFDKPSSWSSLYDGPDDTILIKRVAAVPGDTLSFDGKDILRNGESIFNLKDEDYKCEDGDIGYEHTLTKSEVFAMGDNPHESLDSRRIFCDGNSSESYIQKKDLVNFGRVLLKF